MTKMFAGLDSNKIVVTFCIAESLEKAKEMQPNFIHVEMTLENSPATVGYYFNGKVFEEKK